MLSHVQKRYARRLRACVLVLPLLLLIGRELSAQFCNCPQRRPFGSCASFDLAFADSDDTFNNRYQGDFPGPAAVIAREGEIPWVFFADIFGGVTYRYDGTSLSSIPHVVFESPRGNLTTSGLAYNPIEERLYWAIGTDVVDTIVVTEAPSSADTSFRNVMDGMVPLEFKVDLEGLADRLFGDADRAGSIGDLTFHPHRLIEDAGGNVVSNGTLWAVDIVNDVYFELTLDGQLVLDANGDPVHFFNPELSELSDKAFGNSLTFAEDESGQYFDLLVGSVIEGRPTKVVRVLAESDPGTGKTFGMDTGLRYSLFPFLVADDPEGAAFPTAIAHWPNSCAESQSSEFVMVYDNLGSGEASTVVQVSVDSPLETNVADFTCQPVSQNAVQLTWRNTGGYTTLELFRTKLTDPAPVEVPLLPAPITDDADPEQFLDSSFGTEVDGTYLYRAVTPRVEAVTCTVTIGRGSVLRNRVLPAPSGGSASEGTPYAVTRAGNNLVVVDANTGIAQRLNSSTLAPAASFAGPFADGGTTTGIAYNGNGRLFWLGRIDQTPYLQSTDLSGGFPDARHVVPFPPQFPRTAAFGDLSYDAAKDQFWAVDRQHTILFAIRLGDDPVTGLKRPELVPDSVISNPIVGGDLGGGVAVAAADADSITLDIVAGRGGTADTLVRNTYARSDLGNPATEYTLALSESTRSAAPGGVEVGALTDGGETRHVQYVVGTDTRRVYLLQLDESSPGDIPFQRGDANNDGALNISDPSFMLSWLFRGGPEPPCTNAADVDDSGLVNLTDAVALFDYLFRGGSEPAAPGPTCGFDVTPSPDVDCEDSTCL